MHWTFGVRIVQLLFALLGTVIRFGGKPKTFIDIYNGHANSLLVLCLSAAAIAEFSTGFNSLNFLLFCGIWALLSLVYLVIAPSTMPQFHHKFIAAGVEFLCMIFFFAGFIAVAADIGTINCNAIDSFFSRLKTGCQCTQAAIAFGAFSWVLFLVTLVLVVREIYLEQSGNMARGPGPMDNAIKDGDVRMDNMETGRAPPMSDPNL